MSDCIKINRFQVPEAVERGRSALLHCDYALDSGEELYSIKLYKNNVEFYRFVPGENPPKQSYKLNGIYVNVSNQMMCRHTWAGRVGQTQATSATVIVWHLAK